MQRPWGETPLKRILYSRVQPRAKWHSNLRKHYIMVRAAANISFDLHCLISSLMRHDGEDAAETHHKDHICRCIWQQAIVSSRHTLNVTFSNCEQLVTQFRNKTALFLAIHDWTKRGKKQCDCAKLYNNTVYYSCWSRCVKPEQFCANAWQRRKVCGTTIIIINVCFYVHMFFYYMRSFRYVNFRFIWFVI